MDTIVDELDARLELPLRSAELYRALLDSMSEGVSLSTDDGVIVYTNPAEDRMFGYAPGELVGQHVSVQNAYPAEENARVVAEVMTELKRSGAWRGEWLNRRKDGSVFVTTSRISAVEVGGRAYWLCVQEDVTSEKAAQDALRGSEARLELAASAAGLGIWDWDVRTNRFIYSARAREICGFDPDQEITYEDVRRVTHPEDFPLTSAQSLRALDPKIRSREPYHYRIVRPDGEVRWVSAWGEAHFEMVDGEERATRYVGTLQDVTDFRDLEESERKAAQRLRLAVEASRMAVWEVDVGSETLIGSPELNRVLGLPEDARPTLADLRPRYYPGEMERLTRIRQEALARGERFIETEYRFLFPDGSVHWLQLRCEIQTDAERRPTRIVGVVSDITERKQAELRNAVLAELNERIRDLDDPAEISFIAAEVLGRALGVSRAGYGVIDTVAETITIARDWNAPGIEGLAGVLRFRDYGSYIDDLKRGETVVFADAEKDPRTAATAAALKAISAQSVVNMPVTEQGRFVALLYLNHETARPWPAHELALIREVAEVTRTVTERRRAEQALRELNEQLERRVDDALAERKLWADVFASSDAVICAVGPDYRFLAFNDAFVREFSGIYGVQPKVGASFAELLADQPDELRQALAVWDRALAGEEFTVTAEFGDPDHDRRTYDIRFNTLRDRSGRMIGAFEYAVDVTERLRSEQRLADAEAALRQSQKMEAMGQLTGGVAHDFNNLLTPIMAGLDMLNRRGLPDERSRRMVAGALQSAERAQTLVQRLLAFARRQPLQPAPVDVGRLASGMGALISSTTGPRIRVSVHVEADTPSAMADANQLEMAILNLAVNARDAMPDGGALSITVAPDAVRRRNALGLAAGRYVRLSVADTGVGMDAETAKRAVEPFFSTKGVGKGTGLGLSMVHGLAAQLGGALKLNSQPGLGTNVELWLPVADEAALAPAAAEPVPAAAAKVGVALLVEDEEIVRSATADMLSDIGYAVVEVATAEEALERLDAGLAVDVIVTDHLMPGMTGTDLACQVRAQRPNLPVLIVSGYAEVEGVSADLPRLTKPFRQSDLALSIAAITGQMEDAAES